MLLECFSSGNFYYSVFTFTDSSLYYIFLKRVLIHEPVFFVYFHLDFLNILQPSDKIPRLFMNVFPLDLSFSLHM